MTDANITVRLDTKKAKGELRGLTRAAEGAGRGISGSVSQRLGRGMGAMGLGGVGGMMAGAVQGPMREAAGGLISSTLGPAGEQFTNWMFNGKNLEAKANQLAMAQRPHMLRGILGKAPEGDYELFQHQVNQHRLRLEGASGPRGFSQDKKYMTDEARNIRNATENPGVFMRPKFWGDVGRDIGRRFKETFGFDK